MLTVQSDVIFVFNMLFSRNGSNKPVSFDYISCNNLPQCRSKMSVITFKVNTFYWMSMSVDIPNYTQVNLTMNDEFLLVKTNVFLKVADTLSKDELFHIDNQDGHLSVISLFSTNAIYGSGFQLDKFFYPLTAFHVASLHCLEQNPIELKAIYHNIGNAWNISTNKFVAPHDGLYYFSVNIKIPVGLGFEYKIMHNGNVECSLQKGMANNFISRGNFDFMSKSCFVKMKVMDQMELWGVKGYICTSTNNEQISLSGFNYSPKNELQVK